MQDVVTKVLMGGGIGAVALMLALLLGSQFDAFCGFVRRLSTLERTLLAGFLIMFVAYGGTKPVDPEPPDEGPCREVIDGVEWTYMVRDGYAVLGGDDMIHPAVASTTKELNIPSIVGGYPVRRIGSGAFSGLAVTNAVTIPDGVVEIGTNAFYSCGSLKDVTFPAGLRTIEPRAFYNCQLSSVRLPSSVREIGEEAFYGTNVRPSVYDSCGSIWEVVVDSATNLVIGTRAFYGQKVSKVWISGKDIVIGKSAFKQSMYVGYEGYTTSANYDIRLTGENICVEEYAFDGLQHKQDSSAVLDLTGVSSLGSYAFGSYGLYFRESDDAWYERGSSQCMISSQLKHADTNAFAGADFGVVYCDDLETVFGVDSMLGFVGKPFYCYYHFLVVGGTRVRDLVLPSGTTEVPDYAFSFTHFDSIAIPDGVRRVGMRAFNHSHASVIRLPDSLEEIGDYAFGSSDISAARLPSRLTAIPEGLFSDCLQLEDVNIPEGVVSIGASAFEGTSLKELVLPSTLKSIGSRAFSGLKRITLIEIPHGVTNIGYYAFMDCSALTSVNIPTSVEHIGSGAFYRCSKLQDVRIPDLAAWCRVDVDGADNYSHPFARTKILRIDGRQIDDLVIPDGVTKIGSHVFCFCTNIVSVTIPASVREIGVGAFDECPNIGEFVVEEGNPNYESIDGALYSTSSPMPLYVPCAQTRMRIRDGVEVVDSTIIKNSSSLTAVYIPASVTSIVASAFSSCRDKVNLELSPDNTSYLMEDGLLYTADGKTLVFANASVDNPLIRRTAESIASSAFDRCVNIKTLDIPDSVKTIDWCACRYCTSLEKLTIAKSVVSISSSAFSGCTALKEVMMPFVGVSRGLSYYSGDNMIERVFGRDVSSKIRILTVTDDTVLAKGALSACTSLEELVLPFVGAKPNDSSDNFLGYAFGAAKYVDNAKSIPASLKHVAISNVTDIAAYAFFECGNLESVTLPEELTNISMWAFQDCKKLSRINIPEAVRHVGHDAFFNCSNLPQTNEIIFVDNCLLDRRWVNNAGYRIHEIVIPEGTRLIGDDVYGGGSDDKARSVLTIPSSVRYIGASAFSGCTELKQVVFCGSAIQIGASAFYGCKRLTDVFANSLEDWFGLSFAGPTSNPLYYAGALHLGDVEVRSVLTIPESVTAIPACAFCGLRGVNLVEFGGSIARIGQSAFSDTPEIASYSFAGATPPQFDYNCFGTSASGRQAYVRPGSSGWEALESRYGMEVVETESVPPTYAIAYCHLEGAENANVGSYTVTNGVEFSALENRPGQAFLGWLPSRIDAGTVGDLCVTALWARVSLEANPVMPWSGVVQIKCTVSNDLPATSQVVLRCVAGGVTNELSHLSGSIGSANGTYCLQWNMQQDGISTSDGVELLATVEGVATYGRRYSRMVSQSYAWKTVDTPAYSGRIVWQSGNVGRANSSSTMKISLQGPMTFDFAQRTSCEKTYDKLICYMDEVQLFEAMSGDSGAWTEKSVAVPRGAHTLRWTYTKDSQDNKYSDCAYVALPGDMVTQGFAVTSAVARLIRVCTVTFYKTSTHWQAGEAIEEREVGEGGTLGTLPSASMVGYTFDGWWTVDENYDGEIVNAYKSRVDAGTAVTEDMAICGKWIANAYCITFDANGGEGTMADEPMTYDAEKSLTACAFTRKGYTFAGWAHEAATGMSPPQLADAEVVSNLTAEADGVVTLYAKWTPNNYVIDFNPGWGGTGTMSDQPMTYDEEAALYANLFTRTGYTFLGWTDDEGELEEVLLCDGVVVSNLTDEVDGEYDLYAVWAANEYTVRFNANGGEGTMAEMGFLYDEVQALRANAFTRTGYAFAGWACEAATGMSPPQLADAEVVSNLTAEADGVVTLYAVWMANAYTVKFYANGGNGTMANLAMKYDASKALTANAFSKTGYTFAGWATSAGGAVVYANGASVKNLAAAQGVVVNLYAKWTANTYSVKFDANGGVGTMTDGSMTYDAAKALTANGFTRAGYVFAGWATSKDGEVAYADGAGVKNLVSSGATVLYAKWVAIGANAYAISLNANGGTGVMEPLKCEPGRVYKLPKCGFAKPEGKTRFAGWAGSNGRRYDDEMLIFNLAQPGETVRMTAIWE